MDWNEMNGENSIRKYYQGWNEGKSKIFWFSCNIIFSTYIIQDEKRSLRLRLIEEWIEECVIGLF